MRVLADARGNALDRIGSDLGCPRFADELVWDAVRRSPATQPLSPPGRLEDNTAEYRHALLRGWRLPTPSWGESVLNSAPGPGLPAPVEIDETRNAVHVAFRLVAPAPQTAGHVAGQLSGKYTSSGPPAARTGDTAHQARLLPQRVQDRVGRPARHSRAGPCRLRQPLAPGLASDAGVARRPVRATRGAPMDGCRRRTARRWRLAVRVRSRSAMSTPDPAVARCRGCRCSRLWADRV